MYLNYRDKYTTHTPTCSIVSSDPTQCTVSPRRQWVSSSGSCDKVLSDLSGLDGLSVLTFAALWPGPGPGWHPPHRPETRRVRDLYVQQVSVTSNTSLVLSNYLPKHPLTLTMPGSTPVPVTTSAPSSCARARASEAAATSLARCVTSWPLHTSVTICSLQTSSNPYDPQPEISITLTHADTRKQR